MGMDIVVKIIGILFICIAVVYLLKPTVMKWLIGFFKKGKRIYLAGLVRFALAVVFLLAARECKNFWVIFAFGILFIISGLLIFVLGPKRLNSILDWYQKQSLLLLRLIALIVLAIGAVIIYAA
ncbi:MAG: hypothetical protein ACYS1A_20160 [Planctomycetota bacterium]|jgi:uncharacterized protein YjeT (DUF2065 family)